MKKESKKTECFSKNGSHKVRKGLIIGTSMLGVFAASAASAFTLAESKVTVIDLRTGDDAPIALSGKDKFIANLADSATTGLSITVNDFKFDQYYVDEQGNEDTTKGHNTITNGVNDQGESAPITVALKMDELSLHGINLAVTAPLAYSNNGKDAKYRGVHASLLPYSFNNGEAEQTLFLNLFDNGNQVFSTDDEGKTVTTKSDGGTWDFKYRVSVEPKDANAFDTSANGTDSTTRGTVYYEYGELDWLLSDILDILSEGAISVDFGDMIDGLVGRKNAKTPSEGETEEAASSSEETVEANGISIDKIMDSMGQMQDIGTKNAPYFVWELPLGDKELVLGLGADTNYNLSHVDLPAKAAKDEDGKYTLADSAEPWKIQDGMTLSASADISGTLPSNWSNQVYGNASDYKNLCNSAALFKEIATLAAKPELSVDAKFTLGHNEDAVEGSRTVLKKDAIDESAIISLNANADLYDDSAKEYSFEGLDLDLKIDRKRESNEFKGHQISLAYLPEEVEGTSSKEYNGYLNVNDVLLAKTSKTYIDELYSDIKESVFFSKSEETITEESGEENTTTVDEATDGSVLDTFVDLLGDDIKAIMDSDVLNGVKSGSYTFVADLIDEIKADDNLIKVSLTTKPLGIEKGKIELTLNSNADSLLGLEISGISFGNFSLEGYLHIDGIAADYSISQPAIPEGKSYQSLSHVKGILSTVEDIAESKSFSAKLSGNAYGEDKAKTLGIDGDLAFNFNEGVRSGEVDVELDTYGKVNQQHNIALGLQNDLEEIAFSYDTMSTKEGFATQKTDNQIQGKIGMTAAKSAIEKFDLDFLMKFLGNDDRFSRLTTALLKQEGSSLLSDLLNGQYFGLLEKQGLISNVSLGAATILTIDASKLGMEGTYIDLEIAYDEDETVSEEDVTKTIEGGISAINVAVKKENNATFDKKFELSIGEIDTLEDTSEEIKPFEDTSKFDNYTPFVDLANELVNTITMGMYATGDKASAIAGISNYGLKGVIGLEIAGYETTLYDFDANAAVEGAEARIGVDFDDMPVIRGINGPTSDTYFRRNELEGKRDSNIYFYANGVNPEGELLLTRDSSYGRVRNVQDAVRVSGKDYTDDFLNWILKYTLGVNEDLLEKEEVATEEETAATESESEESSSWNPFANGVHIADCWKGFKAVESANKTTYTLSIDLGKLLGIGLLGETSLSLVSNDLYQGQYSARCLSEVHVNAKADVTSTSDTTMHLASVNVDLGLINFGTANDSGALAINPVLSEGTDYYNLFVKTVDDSGSMTAEGTSLGGLYTLVNGFQSDDVDNPYYGVYGYNLLGTINAKAGNFYL